MDSDAPPFVQRIPLINIPGMSMTQNCTTRLPSVNEYFSGLSVGYIVAFAVAATLTLIVIIMYIETIAFFFINLYNWKPKDKAKWVLAIYPIFCLTSFVSLIVPRASNVNSLIASVYLSLCMYQFVTMLVGHYGGAHKMSSRMHGTRIRLSTPPCCCCCRCLPSPPVSSRSIHRLQTLVLQCALINPLLAYSCAIIWANEHYYSSAMKNPATYLQIFSTLSTILAMWGLSIIYKVSAPMLTHAHVYQKFICLQLVILFNNLQTCLFNVLVMAGAIGCEEMLSAEAVALRYQNLILIFEMFVISVCARRFYRRSLKDIPFDEQIYVQTVNMATAANGTLMRPAIRETGTGPGRPYSGVSFGTAPSSAQEIIAEETYAYVMRQMDQRSAGFRLDAVPAGEDGKRRDLANALSGKNGDPYEEFAFRKTGQGQGQGDAQGQESNGKVSKETEATLGESIESTEKPPLDSYQDRATDVIAASPTGESLTSESSAPPPQYDTAVTAKVRSRSPGRGKSPSRGRDQQQQDGGQQQQQQGQERMTNSQTPSRQQQPTQQQIQQQLFQQQLQQQLAQQQPGQNPRGAPARAAPTSQPPPQGGPASPLGYPSRQPPQQQRPQQQQPQQQQQQHPSSRGTGKVPPHQAQRVHFPDQKPLAQPLGPPPKLVQSLGPPPSQSSTPLPPYSPSAPSAFSQPAATHKQQHQRQQLQQQRQQQKQPPQPSSGTGQRPAPGSGSHPPGRRFRPRQGLLQRHDSALSRSSSRASNASSTSSATISFGESLHRDFSVTSLDSDGPAVAPSKVKLRFGDTPSEYNV